MYLNKVHHGRDELGAILDRDIGGAEPKRSNHGRCGNLVAVETKAVIYSEDSEIQFILDWRWKQPKSITHC